MDKMLPLVPESREEISVEWLQEALKQYPFDILGFSWGVGGVGGGIGVMSEMERITLKVLQDGELRELNLVIKTPPNSNPGLRSFVLNEGFCQREYLMYTKVFPSWVAYQESRNTPLHHRFRSPFCYYSAQSGEGTSYKMILLLEDLTDSGFSSHKEGYRKGLRWGQAKAVVREMALFHAVGMAYKEAQGLKHYAGEEYSFLYTHSKDQTLLDGFLRSGISKTVDMLTSTSNNKGEQEVPLGLIEDLEAFHDVKGLQEASFPREERKGTITHQDLHVHNVMFNTSLANGDSPVALLDFQGCSYANPMADLTFFLLLNCDPSLYTTDLLSILSYYSSVFSSAIHAMDSEVKYPLEEILEDYLAPTNLFGAVVHIMMGSPSWCFGPYTGEDSVARYKTALIDSYERCGYRLGLECCEQFPYFEAEE